MKLEKQKIQINKKALVSIIVPYYKKKNFIKSSVLSILNQSYQNFEIIIVYDDTCLDDLGYIKKVIKLDKRINLLINKKNYGAGYSRNIGVNLAKGKFIAFLDADDLWKRNKLKFQIDFMIKNKFNITHTSYKIIDEKKNVIGQRKAKNFFHIDKLLKSCDIGLSTVILEKKIFLGTIKFGNTQTKEDFILWLKILKKNIKIGAIDKNLTLWRKVNNSLSSSILQKLIDGFRVYNKYMKFSFFKSFCFLVYLSVNSLKK